MKAKTFTKLVGIAMAAVVCVGLSGCTQTIHLRKSPPGRFLDNIKTDESKNVSYALKSNLPEPFKYKNISIDLNSSFASNLKHYLGYKYFIVEDDG